MNTLFLSKENIYQCLCFVSLILVSLVLVSPFIFNKAMIVGSDTIFHFNRIYDTAMQIKNDNFQYFISMYGFQSSGRIVNAFYGPFIVYAQGILLLTSYSWYHYAIISNFILYLLSGTSMYLLQKKLGVNRQISLPISMFYMTTYSIQYWTLKQGFSSWGAAVLPICLIPLIDLLNHNRFSTAKVALSMALMTQIHMLSALMLVLVYVIFFIFIFFKTDLKNKIILIKKACLSVLLYLLLSANIIYTYMSIFSQNTIARPFFNTHMDQQTIFKSSNYWITTPTFFGSIIFLTLLSSAIFYISESFFFKATLISAITLLFLSTQFFPWRLLNDHFKNLVGIIQFPFRFFIPFTTLILILLALSITHIGKISRLINISLALIITLSIGYTIYTTNKSLNIWHQTNNFLSSSIHTYISSKDERQIKDSFFAFDKGKSLNYIFKSTPDYLPLQSKSQEGLYNLYHKSIIDQQSGFHKEVKHKKLVLTWYGSKKKKVIVPVIKYQSTNIVFNRQNISDSVLLNRISVVQVQQRIGKNKIVLFYKNNYILWFVLSLTILSWVLTTAFCLFIKSKNRTIFF